MMLGRMIQCENCKEKLGPESVQVGVNEEGKLVRRCCYCGHTEVVDDE